MTAEQLAELILHLDLLCGVVMALIFATTWKG